MIKKPPEEEGFSTDAPTLIRTVSGSGRMIGSILGNQYKIVEVIGEGGIGVVYRARQLTVDRDVAVKVLKRQWANDDLAVRRFENEASAIARLRHPNTLRLYDCQRTTEGELYIVTELLSGSPLDTVLKDQGRLPIERALRTFDEICRSLAEAHAAGIIHRDLKPANVFLDRIGNEDVVKVLDFGIAKILQTAGITRAGAVPGTPQYMSPEQAAAGKVDHRADIYSIGVILYQMIVGRAPFDGPSVVEILSKHITENPPRFAERAPELVVPAELERLVMWMLEKNPEDRPPSIEEIRRYLPGILAQVTTVSPFTVPRLDSIRSTEWGEETAVPPRPPAMSPTHAALFEPAPEVSGSKKWRWFSVVTGSIGVIIGVMIGYANIPSTVVIPKRAVEVLPPDTPIETEPIVRLATIVTEPPGARVIAPDGTSIGVTPLSIALSGVSTYLVMRDDGANGAVTLSADKDAGRTVEVALVEPAVEKKEEPKPEPKAEPKRRRQPDRRKRSGR